MNFHLKNIIPIQYSLYLAKNIIFSNKIASEKGDNSHKPLDGSGTPAISAKWEMRESHLDNLLVKMTGVLLFERSVGWRIGKGKRGED